MTGLTLSSAAEIAQGLKSSARRKQARALLFVAPLLAFVVVMFLAPICLLLARSVSVPEVPAALPETTRALAKWDGVDLPPEPAWAALVRDLAAAQQTGTASKLATALNQEVSGIRSVVIKTARESASLSPPYRAALTALDPQWPILPCGAR